MFGPNVYGTGLTVTKVLGGLSKALGIANQAIPLYQQIKPMVGNARKVMSVLKEFNTPVKETPAKKAIISQAKEKEVIEKTITSPSHPVFFQ